MQTVALSVAKFYNKTKQNLVLIKVPWKTYIASSRKKRNCEFIYKFKYLNIKVM